MSQFGRGEKRTLGDLWDESAEKSERRAQQSPDGKDPVLQKALAKNRRNKTKLMPVRQAGTGKVFEA